MAISLNSINSTLSSYGTRITNLENRGSAGITVIYNNASGTYRLSSNISAYDIVFITYGCHDTTKQRYSCVVFPKKVSSMLFGCHAPGEYHATLSVTSTSQVSTLRGQNNCKIYTMIGLKLYYNFSYNILHEFLSKIKIKLIAFLETLPKKRR